MKQPFPVLIAYLLISCGMSGQADSIPEGRFVYRSESQDVEFEISLPAGQSGTAMAISFAARSLSGRGPAPDGEMHGVPADGQWTVSFTDSFGNAGKGTIQIELGLMFLTLQLEQIVEPRCARFYGSMWLEREGFAAR